MILGFTSQTKGYIQFEGDPNYHTKRKTLNKIGFLLDCRLFEDFSAYDNLKLFSMYSSTVNEENLDDRIERLLKFVGLDNSKKTSKILFFWYETEIGFGTGITR